MEPDHAFSFEELWPYLVVYGEQHRFNPKIIAAMIQQESTWHNYRVHRDGTGHGLLGLDENGLLRDYQTKYGVYVGLGANAEIMPPELQIDFTAWQLRRYMDAYPDVMTDPVKAAQAWHASGGGRDSPRGLSYREKILGHITRLFP